MATGFYLVIYGAGLFALWSIARDLVSAIAVPAPSLSSLRDRAAVRLDQRLQSTIGETK